MHRVDVRFLGAVMTGGAAVGALTIPSDAAAAPQQLRWGPCAKIHDARSAQCATIDVPRDYAKPQGATIEVTINRPGYPSTITTENTARHIEMARRALGVPQLSLYGLFYGMATYSTLFPQHTDRLVLDSAVDPTGVRDRTGNDQTPAYKRRVCAMMAWIAQHDNIYHLDSTPLAVYRRWGARVEHEAAVPPSLSPPPDQVGDVPTGLKAMSQLYRAGTNLTADARARLANMIPRLKGRARTQAEKGAASASKNMHNILMCKENQYPSQQGQIASSPIRLANSLGFTTQRIGYPG